MNSPTDQELLRSFAETGSEDAFEELVARHVDFVYSVALRIIRDRHLAEDVAQAVFVALAQSAAALQDRLVLFGWLHLTARNAAAKIIRTEERRKLREQEAATIPETMSQEDSMWEAVAPHLDNALQELSENEREALLLRYFAGRSSKEIADALAIGSDAAQKRVNRAVDHLRVLLAKHGVATGTSGLAAAISVNAVEAAPAGLASAITCSVALAGTTLTAATATAVTKVVAMTAVQKLIVGATVAIAVATGAYKAYEASELRDRVATLERVASDKNRQFELERNELSGRVDALLSDNQRSRSNIADLAEVREELARLRTTQPPRVPETAEALPAALHRNTNTVAQTENDLPKSSWADSGFLTPRDALRTRGWCVLTGNRERFKQSVFITPEARKELEDMFVRMAEASSDPNKGRYLQQIIGNNLGVEEGFLMPMMAENQRKEFTGYRIVSQQSPAVHEMVVDLETSFVSEPPKNERLKFWRIGDDWKVVIDTEFLNLARRR